jgi:hypothetical protein
VVLGCHTRIHQLYGLNGFRFRQLQPARASISCNKRHSSSTHPPLTSRASAPADRPWVSRGSRSTAQDCMQLSFKGIYHPLISSSGTLGNQHIYGARATQGPCAHFAMAVLIGSPHTITTWLQKGTESNQFKSTQATRTMAATKVGIGPNETGLCCSKGRNLTCRRRPRERPHPDQNSSREESYHTFPTGHNPAQSRSAIELEN